MDKRLLNFMLVSMLLFIGYMELLKVMNPPPPVDEDAEVAEQVEDEDGQPAPVPADASLAEAEPDPDLLDAEVAPEAEAEDVAALPDALERFTIGSIDPDSGYAMLVTLINQGAAVERIELSDPKYRDLEDKTAYIGHLGLTPDGNGLRVTCVGDGTPASIAGMEVGDVVTAIGDATTGNLEAYELARQEYRFGDSLEFTVNRGGSSRTLSVASIRRPLEVVRPELLPNGSDELQQHSYLLTLHQISHRSTSYGEDELKGLPSLMKSNWLAEVSVVDEMPTVEFRFPMPASTLKEIGINGSLEVVKRFSIRSHEATEETTENERKYHFDFDVEFVNKGSENLEVGYRVDGPTGLPLEGWWYSYKTHPSSFAGAGMRDVIFRADGEGHDFYTNPMVTKRLKKNPDNPELIIVDNGEPKKMQYVGVDAQYFSSALMASFEPDAAAVILKKLDAHAISEVDELRASRTPITFRADSTMVSVPPQQSTTHDFEIFAGPKHPDVLDDYGLDECIVYGWFKMPAKIMGWLLHLFYSIVRSYGLSIILLTLLVRACMFPIGRQQAQNAKKMQELTPEIKKIKEKYPSDTEKQAKAQQELFRKHNYNPVAGCLPMFLQLPIFIGLYRALSVDIELRQTPLIPGVEWCSNLAAPDMMFRWDSMLPFEFLTGYAGYLGPFFNLLPIISTGFFLLHQQLFTPPPTDEQQEMQQKVMKFMMLFMLVLFFKVPAGLCLYFITSSAWALAERLLLPKDSGKKPEQTPVSLSDRLATAAASVSGGEAPAADNIAAAKKKRRKRNNKK